MCCYIKQRSRPYENKDNLPGNCKAGHQALKIWNLTALCLAYKALKKTSINPKYMPP